MKKSNPYSSPVADAKSNGAGLTFGEKLYCGAVALGAGFFAISAISTIVAVIPMIGDESGLFTFMAAVAIGFALILGITLALNIRAGELLLAPTVFQCLVFTVFVYTIPIAIWGAILLYRRRQRVNTRVQTEKEA